MLFCESSDFKKLRSAAKTPLAPTSWSVATCVTTFNPSDLRVDGSRNQAGVPSTLDKQRLSPTLCHRQPLVHLAHRPKREAGGRGRRSWACPPPYFKNMRQHLCLAGPEGSGGASNATTKFVSDQHLTKGFRPNHLGNIPVIGCQK